MKLLQNKFLIFSVAWMAVFYATAFLSGRFYFFPLGMLFLVVYEIVRTEGVKNTKPLSFLMLVVILLQFLHTTKIFLFPIDVSFIIEFLPLEYSSVDKFLLTSIFLLIIFSLLLIRYTWGSVTKFLAILLLVGSLLECWPFWGELMRMYQSREGQQLKQELQNNIQENIERRMEMEF